MGAHFLSLKEALLALPKWERAVHLFWLCGPFFLLIERTPADIWLSLISLIFISRCFLTRHSAWLREFWVRSSFFFWIVCLISAMASESPVYSLLEVIAWFRFPLFAMAVVFWLGRDQKFIYAMLVSICIAMLAMVCINFSEVLLVGTIGGRLSWPYGDLVPGNFLAKACLPAFVVAVAIATSANNKFSVLGALVAIPSIVGVLLTGERVNFLICLCAGVLAAVVWKPSIKGIISGFVVGVAITFIIFLNAPDLTLRFVNFFSSDLPIHRDSAYIRAMAPGLLAFIEAPFLGVGPGNLRTLCPALTLGSPLYDCHPHPHNFFIQMLGEIGLFGFVGGVLFLGAVIWTCIKPTFRDRTNVVVATMWIVPFGFFWPISSSADFFGQWNNIFMWSAVAVALAGAQIGSKDRSDEKT